MVLLSGAQFGDDSSLAHQFQLVAMDVEAIDGPQNREETTFQFHQFRCPAILVLRSALMVTLSPTSA